jgi:NADP-dependent 3-hydroxy acid dehydrogenase YdfG
MPSSTSAPVTVVIGAGPGLGMSVAHRFGRAGHRVALVSRTAARHAGYLSSLADAGVTASAHAADVRVGEQLHAALDAIRERHGRIDVVYYGPAAMDPSSFPVPITEAGRASVEDAMSWVYPAVDVATTVLPEMVARGDGGLLFGGGLSAVMPMPALGSLAVSSAALRNYAVTLNAGLAEHGVYAGILNIGGVIERGDIHAHFAANPGMFGDLASATLDPDDLAEAAWGMYERRDRAEETFNVLG